MFNKLIRFSTTYDHAFQQARGEGQLVARSESASTLNLNKLLGKFPDTEIPDAMMRLISTTACAMQWLSGAKYAHQVNKPLLRQLQAALTLSVSPSVRQVHCLVVASFNTLRPRSTLHRLAIRKTKIHAPTQTLPLQREEYALNIH